MVQTDTSDPTPLYHQIYRIYRQRILSGALTRGERLPSEIELEKTHRVSRITARRAMDELAREGLVTRERGRGTTVSFAVPGGSVSADFSGLMENLASIGAQTRVDVLAFDYRPAPADIADALGLPPGSSVQRAIRRRSRNGKPFSRIVTHIPDDIGRHFTRGDLTQSPILSLIDGAGFSVAGAVQSVTAVAADEHCAGVLGLKVGSPLLKVTRVVHDPGGRALQHIEIHYRPDSYQLNMRLGHPEQVNGGIRLWATEEPGGLD